MSVNLKDEKNLVVFLKYQKALCKDYIRFVKDLMVADYKKSANFIYWLRTYLGYLKSEDDFNPNLNVRYNRGQIVYVDFGFRVGNELGGAHYAVVLDVKNEKGTPSVTVVPLNSDKGKETKREKIYGVNIGKIMFTLFQERAERIIAESKASLEEIIKNQSFSKDDEIRAGKIRKNVNYARKIYQYAKEKLDKGSIANCGQIVTVSKMRIIYPKKKEDVLYNIIMPKEYMDVIEDKIKYLYCS